MKSRELVTTAERIVKELSTRVNAGTIGPQDAEQEIVEFLNWVGDLMVPRPARARGCGGSTTIRRPRISACWAAPRCPRTAKTDSGVNSTP